MAQIEGGNRPDVIPNPDDPLGPRLLPAELRLLGGSALTLRQRLDDLDIMIEDALDKYAPGHTLSVVGLLPHEIPQDSDYAQAA